MKEQNFNTPRSINIRTVYEKRCYFTKPAKGFTLIQLVFIIQGCDKGEKQETPMLLVKTINRKGIY